MIQQPGIVKGHAHQRMASAALITAALLWLLATGIWVARKAW